MKIPSGVALALVLACTLTQASADARRRIVNSASVNPAVESPPAIDVDEYASYYKPGNNVLKVEMQVHFSDGASQPCNGDVDDALLYPKTAYTMWMIRRYVQGVVGHTKAEHRSYPGDSGLGPAAPNFLIWFKKGSVVRSATCDRGWATFAGLPPGSYVAVGQVSTDVHYSGSASGLRPGVAYDPETGLYQQTMSERSDGYGRQPVSFGHNVMVSEIYTFQSGPPKTAIERNVYSFGEDFGG